MTLTTAQGGRRGARLTALASVGILFATLMLGARVSPAKAVDAQPAECERPLDVVLVIDRSGSMDLVTDGQSRLGWAKDAANLLVTGLNDHGGVGGSGLHRVGLTTYGDRDNSDGIPSGVSRDLQLGTSDAAAVHAAINAYSDSAGNGNTPFRYGMADGAANLLAGDRSEVDGVPVLQVLIFLSDGRPNPDNTGASGSRPTLGDITGYLSSADQAYGIAIGPDGQGDPLSEPDLDLMHAISNPDPDNFRHVVDAASLPDLFADIQDELLCGDIHITKTPDPAGPVDAGTNVTYTYDVTNSGDTPLSNVKVSDDTCAPVEYQSGDNGNSLLENGETWTYSCSMALQETTTNEACADGDFLGGGHDSACADVTVEVNPPAPSVPSIEIRKSSDADGTVEPGTLVTYTYEVENTGETALANVDVTDLISDSDTVACEVDSADYAGDGGNGILDIGETWTFSCSTSLNVTTSNEACVVADVVANQDLKIAEQQVEACDDEKVEVSQSPEQTVEAGTGTPAASTPDTSLNGAGGGVLPTILFSFVLLSSLGTLAFANVRAMRRRS